MANKIDNNTKKKAKVNSNSNFGKKFLLFAFLVILFSFLSAFFIKRSYAIVGKQSITYQENSNLDYRVFLKSNDFYETDYLGKDMVYVASLVDKIDVYFDYLFKIDKKSDIDFEYDVIGKLVINDKSKGNTFFEKEYVLLKNTKDNMIGDDVHNIKQSVSIDYGKYNNLANQFRSKYGVDVNCNLIVYLNIREKSSTSNKFVLSNSSSMSLSIPLSEKAINITMDYNDINKTSKLVKNEKFVITNFLFVVLGILATIIFIYVVVVFIKLLFSLRVKKSNYDKYVDRLLREYDRLIVETVTEPVMKGKDVIEILKFQELLDVRDNLKLPIKYYVVKGHNKCYFYINHEKEVYLFVVDADKVNKS